jgi:transcriptional regulator with XRE-family HTH domain
MTKLLKHQTSQSILTGVPETEQFNPARLTLARKRHGLTKGELAVKVKVDLRAIVAYEAGEYPPSDDTLRVIASKLEFPIEFFFGPNTDEPSVESEFPGADQDEGIASRHGVGARSAGNTP